MTPLIKQALSSSDSSDSTVDIITNWLEKIDNIEYAKKKALSQLRINEHQELCQVQKKLTYKIKKEFKNLSEKEKSSNKLKKISIKLKNTLAQNELLLNDAKSIIDITKKKLFNQHYNHKGKVDADLKHFHSLSMKA